jgi:hypothetical protein
MKNGIATLEQQTIARLARLYNYAPVPDVLEGFARVCAVINAEVAAWPEVPPARKRELLRALGRAAADEMRAFDRECRARDGRE